MLEQTFKPQLLRWGLGRQNAVIQGIAVALKSFLTLAGVNAAGISVPTLNLHQAVYIFLGGAGYHFLDYLTKNPLPTGEDVSRETRETTGGTPVLPSAPIVPETQNQAGNAGIQK